MAFGSGPLFWLGYYQYIINEFIVGAKLYKGELYKNVILGQNRIRSNERTGRNTTSRYVNKVFINLFWPIKKKEKKKKRDMYWRSSV